ncbi:MAG: YHS domain-containing protein, partial [Deltaproteobacteria bacterium]|nr:YHS domain-containing protein [Deltaproteobacteria bacterium]
NKQFDKDPEGSLHQEAKGGSGEPKAPVVANTVKDPVCGLPVATGPAKQAGRTSEYEGKLYYFDTDGCKQRFDKDPQYYLTGGSEAASPQTYPQVPTSPDLLLRLRRDSIRAIPPGKGQAPVEDPRQESHAKPAAPQTPPMQPPAPPSPPPQPQVPQAAPLQPQVPQPAPSLPQPQAPKAAPLPPQPQAPPPQHPGGGGHQHD